MSKKKEVDDLLSKALGTEKYIAPEPEEVKKTPSKIGRPTEKKRNIEYVKLSARVPYSTRQKVKQKLIDLDREFLTQDEMVNFALLYFIDHYKK